MIGNLYYTSTKHIQPKTLSEAVQEVCLKTEPKSIFCELPNDLKIKSISASGTAQISYTYTSSMASLPSIGTSTTTT